MKKSLLTLLVVVSLTTAISGCVISVKEGEVDHALMGDSKDRDYKNRKIIAKIHLGSRVSDMEAKLGVADFSQTYQHQDDTIRVLYYRSQRKHKDGLTTKDECTYLEFVNGTLTQTGAGEDYFKITLD